MKTLAPKNNRIHSLDSLRAIMMMLGLVLHSVITYCVIDYGDAWPLKDTNATHITNDFLAEIIHTFRMQIFFLVAGFFGAMLFYERNPRKMITNRVSRIVLPFIVFVLLLWPSIVFCFSYAKLIFTGSSTALETTISYFSNPLIFIPLSTFHLWFLYYLTMITFTTVGLGLILKKFPTVTTRITSAFNWILNRSVFRILIFSGITALIYFFMGSYQVATSNSFIPDLDTFVYYLSFYLVGWVLFKSKHLLHTFMESALLNTLLALALFITHFIFNESISYTLHIVINSINVWLFIFGITGLFIHYGSKYSPIMRYVSDSSYWVYLIHLPIVVIIQGLIAESQMPSTLKFLFVLIATTIICFFSYHFLVRNSFIGKFLNGRKYSRALSNISGIQSQKTPQLSHN